MIRRSDGSPLYNLAVAVDDRDMGITDVVRGDDHLSNTPRQVLIVRALGGEPPRYAHLPLLHGPDGKKLSKRHGAASVQELRAAGYLPEAVRNYIALLGWGLDESTTFLTTEELTRHFSLERVARNPAVFDEPKLRWMNGRYLRQLAPEDLKRRLEELLGRELPLEAVSVAQEKMTALENPVRRATLSAKLDCVPGGRRAAGSVPGANGLAFEPSCTCTGSAPAGSERARG